MLLLESATTDLPIPVMLEGAVKEDTFSLRRTNNRRHSSLETPSYLQHPQVRRHNTTTLPLICIPGYPALIILRPFSLTS